MAYTKNQDPWADSDLVTTTVLDNFETIYTEASSYLSAHTHDDLYPTKAEMETAYWYSGNDGSGSGSDADLIYKSTGNLHAASFAGMGVPTGLVILWYGAEAAIPAGWHLCDGADGTINLQNRFPVGAGTGSSYSVGDTGTGIHAPLGTVNVAGHALTAAEVAGHGHTFTDYYAGGGTATYWSGVGYAYINGIDSGPSTTGYPNIGKATADAHTHTATFTGGNFTALPPYHALCYIQKISA